MSAGLEGFCHSKLIQKYIFSRQIGYLGACVDLAFNGERCKSPTDFFVRPLSPVQNFTLKLSRIEYFSVQNCSWSKQEHLGRKACKKRKFYRIKKRTEFSLPLFFPQALWKTVQVSHCRRILSLEISGFSPIFIQFVLNFSTAYNSVDINRISHTTYVKYILKYLQTAALRQYTRICLIQPFLFL